MGMGIPMGSDFELPMGMGFGLGIMTVCVPENSLTDEH